MALDFNTEPYFDDYNNEKDFYKILFRPSYAVQARELTQLQTILQTQVSRFGDHMFKNGSQVIPGSVNVDSQIHFIKLEQFTGTVDVTTYIETFKNKVITCETSGVKLRVIDTSSSGNIVDELSVPTLYCKVEGTIPDTDANRTDIQAGEVIIARAEDNQITTNFRLTEDQLTDISCIIKNTGTNGETATIYANNPSSDVVGYAYSVEVAAGIYYIDGVFVRNDALKLYAGRFTNKPTTRVGFKVVEQTITPEDDDSILDNATGSYNFAAPGAHRYKISVELVKLDIGAQDVFKFIELVRLEEGRVLQMVQGASYGELEKTLARRTFDESGNYEVNKFKLSVREHLDDGEGNLGIYPIPPDVILSTDKNTYGDANKFVLAVDPGKAYIEGYEVGSIDTQYVSLPKARDTTVLEGDDPHIEYTDLQTVGITVGNTVNVTNLFKSPNINVFEEVYLVNDLRARPAVLQAVLNGSGYISSVIVVDGGEGYTSAPSVVVENLSASGAGASISLTVSGGKVTAASVGNGGTSPYTIAPYLRVVNETTNIPLGIAPATAKIVGKARVKSIQLYSGDYTSQQFAKYSLGLFDIQMFNGKSFTNDVKSIIGTGEGTTDGIKFSCDIIPSLVNIDGTATSSTSTTSVTGVGTYFLETVVAGDIVYINNTLIGTVSSLTNNTITLSANAKASISGGVLQIFKAQIKDPQYETLLFPTGKSFVKTLKGKVGSSFINPNTSITVRRQWEPKSTQTYKITFETPVTGETFASDADIENFLLIDADTKLPYPITADMITFDDDQNRKLVDIQPVPNNTYYLIASVTQTDSAAVEKSKILTAGYQYTITGKNKLNLSTIDLGHGDIYKLNSVMMTPGDYDVYDPATAIDVTERFTLDNGQRNTYYTYGKLVLKPGYQVPSGCIRADYDYFAYNGDGNFFSADSYSGSNGVAYENVPTFYVTDETTGKKVSVPLTDVIDFRPVLTATNNFYPEIPRIGSDLITPIANYLGRIDKIGLSSVGQFIVLNGVPAVLPKEPPEPKEGLVLATIVVPPYTKNVKEIIINQRENRRYTMRDIGRLETRISNLEYYVTLSLLEKDTASLQIIDETTGLDRFKNGFIVDQFTGHGVGDVLNEDYRISVDPDQRTLRPMHDQVALELVESVASAIERAGKLYQKSGDIITLPFTEARFINNPNATRSLDIQALSMGNFKGKIDLVPEGDNWQSTTRKPDLVVVDDNNYDAIKYMADKLGVTGTEWDAWQTHWTGKTVSTANKQVSSGNVTTGYQITTTTQTGYQSREGVKTTLTSSVNAQDAGDRIVDMSYIPFMRARPITFVAQNLKGGSRFYPYFDGVSVKNYVTPADVLELERDGSSTLMSFEFDDIIDNVISGHPARARGGKIEQGFAFGDVLSISTHSGVNITAISPLAIGETASTIDITVSDATNIRAGHHVRLHNLNYWTAPVSTYKFKNLNDLYENQYNMSSVGLIYASVVANQTARKLNLQTFKVISVNGGKLTVARLDGKPIAGFGSYNTAGYSGTNRGRLVRLKASCVAVYGGEVLEEDSHGTFRQNVQVVNVKNGIAIGDILSGNTLIAKTKYYNGVKIKSINGSNIENVAPTMKTKGSALTTDKYGSICGIFDLPDNDTLRFRTGERTFKLTDNQSNSDYVIDSIGEQVYYSTGISLTKERTIISSRTAKFVETDVYQETKPNSVKRITTTSKVIYQWVHDPLAQTFTVNNPGGVFVSSIDLYFSEAGNRPISVQIRNTDNGTPSNKILPFSTVTKTPRQIKTSTNGSTATRFKFPSPIYLQDNETYAFVVLTSEPGAQVYVSEMGAVDMISGNVIAGQPLTGSLYASQNAREWEIHPLLDMKFDLNKCVFDTSVAAELVLETTSPDRYNIDYNPFEITPNTDKVRVFARNHGHAAGETVVLSGLPEGNYGTIDPDVGIPHTLFNKSHVVLSEGLERDSFIIQLETQDDTGNTLLEGGCTLADLIKGEYGGGEIICSRSAPIDVLYYKNSDINFPDTKTTYFVAAEPESGWATSILPTTWSPFVPNQNYYFQERHRIRCFENQKLVSESPLTKKSSLFVKCVLQSTNTNLSPVVDMQQLSAIAVWNLIDSKEAGQINVPEIDERVLLQHGGITNLDRQDDGIGTISVSGTAVTGTNTDFTLQVYPGNKLYLSDGTTLVGTVSTVNSATSITLTASATARTNVDYIVRADAYLYFENDTTLGKGMIRTNIDTADNLLDSAGVGKTLLISGIHANIDGTYVVHDIKSSKDTSTYAGNHEFDKTVVYVDRLFTTTTSIDLTTDSDFVISVYDKFIDDFAPYGVHNAANYVTRTLTLSESAEVLRIMFDANIMNKTELKVFYRTWSGDTDLRKLPWVDTGWAPTGFDGSEIYKERTITVTDIPAFNNVQMKIVMKSTNPTIIPKVKNLRMLALS